MKINFTRTIAVIVCSIVFASVVYPQEKPNWTIFCDFESKEKDDQDLVYRKLAEFLARLAQEPKTTRGFIDIPGNTKLAQEMKAFIKTHSKLTKRIVFSWNTTVPERPLGNFSLMIIPQGVPIPYPLVHEPVICPYIDVSATTKKSGRNIFITFTAKPRIENIPYPELKGLTNLTYEWSISAGEIVKGQGTAKLKVAAKDAKTVTAAVGLGGDFLECERDFSETVTIQK